MVAGTETPAARGSIAIHTGDNGNTKLDIKVRSLAKPTSLTPPQNVYVVWVQPPGQSPVNLGELKVNDDLHGELDTQTPFKRFRVFITAEREAQIRTPQGLQVLTAEVTTS